MGCKTYNATCPNKPVVCGECYATIMIERNNLEGELAKLKVKLHNKVAQAKQREQCDNEGGLIHYTELEELLNV